MRAIIPETTEPANKRSARRFTLPHLRWMIVGLVFLATLINFIDRLTISSLAQPICESLHLNNLEFAKITTWFLLAYTVSQGLSGKLYDRIGTKRGFTFSILLWSAAAVAHGFAQGLTSLCTFRVLLGLGEAGNWPGAAKAIAEWFPVRERALAMGIFNCGTSLGSVIAPPLIYWLNAQFGWQATFMLTGMAGFLWLGLWLVLYYPLASHPWVMQGERELILNGQPRTAPSHDERQSQEVWRWRDLLRYRQVWSIVLARLLVDPVWWLYITWLPKYLGDARGLSLSEIGWRAPIPFVAAGIGSVLGGYSSGFLIRRGWSVNRARKTVIVLAAMLMPAGILAARAEGVSAALAWISLVTFGFQVWINNVQTLPSDLFPQQAVASVAGMGGVGAGIGSMIFMLATGWVVDRFSYASILTIAGLLAPMGTLVLLMLLGRVRPLDPSRG